MNKSDSIANLAAALVAAQAELRNPAYDSKNPHLKNEYASLASVRDTVTPVITRHGLSFTQLLGSDKGEVQCTTVLLHKSGEWISGTFGVPAVKNDPQGFGSAATYARRYSLLALLGVVGDKDDDGDRARDTSAAVPAFEVDRHVAEINAAETLDALKKAYMAANKAATQAGDKAAVQRIVQAKDARKAALEKVPA